MYVFNNRVNSGNKRKAEASFGPLARKAVAKIKRLRGEDGWGGTPSKQRLGALSTTSATQRPRGARGMHGQTRSGTKVAHKQPMRNFKSRDGAKTISEMEASASSEQLLRLAAIAVNITPEYGRLQAELALRGPRQHRSWKEPWPGHVDGYVYIVSLYIASYVSFVLVFYTAAAGIRYQGLSPPAHAYALEPDSRSRVLCARASDPSPSPPHSIRR